MAVLLPALAVAEDGASVSVGVQTEGISFEVESLVREADAAEQAGAFNRAADLYGQALTLSPSHVGARHALARVEAILSGASPDGAHGEDLVADAAVLRQLAEVEISVALQRAELMAADSRFEQAREAVQSAQLLMERYPDLRVSAEVDVVVETIARLHESDRSHSEQVASEGRAAAQSGAHTEMRVELAKEESAFETQIIRIIDLKQRAHYEVALAQARDLVRRYPNDRRAEVLFGEILRLAHKQRKLTTEERMHELKLELNERIQNSMIPSGFDGTPQFPEDWFDVRAHRTAALIGEVESPEWQQVLRDRLAGRMNVAFQEVDVIQALEWVGQEANVNLIIDPELRAAGSVPASLSATGMRIDNIIGWLARHAGTTWSLRNEAVWVGGEYSGEAVVKPYDVAQFMYRGADMPGLGTGFMLQGGGNDFDVMGGNVFDSTTEEGMSPEDVVDLIQLAVAPDVWDANPDYGIVIRDNWLIVTAPSDIHVLIAEFLRSQAAANNVLVRLDIQWLEIQDDFFEEIGMDWNNLAQNVLQSPFRAGYTQLENEWSYQATLRNQLPSAGTTLGQGNFTTGLQLQYITMAVPFLSAVFRAEHRSRKARVLDGIELTTLNGVQSSAFFGRQLAYISDYEVAAGGNLDPVIDVLNVGQSIALRPLVSADRKYVSLDLKPSLASATFFTETLIAERLVGRGPGTSALVYTSAYPLELPNVLVRSAATRVMIPDRGAVLVGGLGRSIEQYAETQIPILGHIPFLGRLFGMRGQYSSRSQLYLTVRARIILYDEEEANL